MSSATSQPVGKGGFVGNVPLGAGAGSFILPLDSIPDGNVGGFQTQITLAGVVAGGTGAGFNLSVTGAPGDDLNVILEYIIGSVSLYLDSKSYLFNKRLIQEVRAACIALRTGQDWGSGVNGFAVPAYNATAKTLNIPIYIPVAIPLFFRGGQALAQGSARFRHGGRFIAQQLIQGGTTPALANGASGMVFTSWSWAVNSQAAKGPSTWVGPNWRLEVVEGYANSVRLDEETYLILAGDYSPATMTTDGVTSDGINVDGQDTKDLTGPFALQGDYLTDHPPVGGGVDPTQYFTPFDWIRQHEAASELPAPQRTKVTIPQLSTLNIFSIAIDQTSATAKANVAQDVGAGGPTAEVTPPIVGTESGASVAASQSSFLPSIIAPPGSPAAAAPGARTITQPAAAGVQQAIKNATAGQPAAARKLLAPASRMVKAPKASVAGAGKRPKAMR